MVTLTQEAIELLDKAASSFDGHVTNGSSVAIRKAVEEIILKYLWEGEPS